MLAIGGAIGDWPEELENPKALTCCCDTPRKTRNVLGRRNIVAGTWMMMLKDWGRSEVVGELYVARRRLIDNNSTPAGI